MSDDLSNPLPSLELPKRWEFLSARATEAGLDAAEFVERVDAAAERVDHLLTRVRTGGGGLFEVFFGLSGSGKTTFLHTLPRFFKSIRVASFPKERPLAELPQFVMGGHVPDDSTSRIVLVERRDNPKDVDIAAAPEMFADLLEVFRTKKGGALVIWPVTKEPAANKLAEFAWDTGRDSVCDHTSKGLFTFVGIPKERYFPVADATSRNLTGDGLEAFGITEQKAKDLSAACETIADFFYAVDRQADDTRRATWSVLKERVRARVWVALPGDLNTAIKATVSALTQGTRNRIDIDLIAEFIDDPTNKALYVADWRTRRGHLAHLFRAFDVRVFGIPPNVCLAAVRAFGDDTVKKALKQPSTNADAAREVMRASRLYKAILTELGVPTTPFVGTSATPDDTAYEYRRIQATAAKTDKALNKALGELIASCLSEDAPKAAVVSEKKSLPSSELKPDIQIAIGPSDYICIEPTWRSTDAGIPNELAGGQNTLKESHIKKYVLDKVTQYVKDLGL